jgi:hypothetical protein
LRGAETPRKVASAFRAGARAMLRSASLALDVIIPIFWFVCAIAILKLLNYIRTSQHATWISLGRLSYPETLQNKAKRKIYLDNMKFIFFSLDFMALNDRRLTIWVWSIRTLTIIWFALLILDLLAKSRGDW